MSQLPSVPNTPAPPTTVPGFNFEPVTAAGNQPTTESPTAAIGLDPAAAAPTPPDEIAQLGQSIGVDLSGFTNADDAKRAAQMVIERYAATGMSQPPLYSTPQQSVNPLTVPPDADDEPEEDAGTLFDGITDPKALKQLKKLDRELKTVKQETNQIKSQWEQQQQAALNQQMATTQFRGHAAIDKLASAKYGVGNQQTFSQQVSRQNLLRLAESIINGLVAHGQPVPQVEQVVQMAAFYDGGATPPVAKDPPKPQAPAPGPFSPQPSNQTGRKGVVNEKTAYTSDAEFMSGARSILARNSGLGRYA